MTRACTTCKEVKPLESFALSRRAKDGRQHSCRVCNNKFGRQNYQDNKARYFAVAKARDRALDRLILEKKSAPCTDCGVSYPPYVMDFDHLDASTKEYNVSWMRQHKMAFAKILAEIEKCELVCANCHRIRSNTRNPSRRYAAILEEKL